jgi:(4-alkanoyl-5-oxo-2,5-dihydrofuran-3-yl)methyl phosphate reductase
MILVIGATGTVGRQLVGRLIEAGSAVRGLTRTPDRAGLPPDVEVVGGDLGRPETLGRAVDGADEIFLLSGGPEGPEHDANLVAAAKEAGVRHIVKLSVLAAGHDGADPITRWHLAGEHMIEASGMAWTFLRPGAFMSNALMWADMIRHQGVVYAPFGQAKTAPIDPADIAEVAARTLTEPGHDGRAYPLTGPELLSPADQVDRLSAVLGRSLSLIDVPPEAAKQSMIDSGMPGGLADAVVATMAMAGSGHAAVVLPTVEEVTKRPARTFADWAANHVAAFR